MKHWIYRASAPDPFAGGAFTVTLVTPGLASHAGPPSLLPDVEDLCHDLPISVDGFRLACAHIDKWRHLPVTETPEALVEIDGDTATLTSDGALIERYRLVASGSRFVGTLWQPIIRNAGEGT